jgi:hypothetical protein
MGFLQKLKEMESFAAADVTAPSRPARTGVLLLRMVVAYLFECVAPGNSCGIQILRPAGRGSSPVCACGLEMRPAGRLLW